MGSDCDNNADKNPRAQYRRTNVLCCFCFLACVITLIAISAYGVVLAGNGHRLTHGYDYNGRLCGFDSGVENEPYLFFCGTGPRGSREFPPDVMTDQPTCVSECPSDTSMDVECMLPQLINFDASHGGWDTDTRHEVEYGEQLRLTVTQTIDIQKSYPTDVFGGKFCVPKQDAPNDLRSKIVDGPLAARQYMDSLGSLEHAWIALMITAFLAIALGFLWMWMLSHYAGLWLFITMVITSITMVIMGIWLMIALFAPKDDPTGWYQSTNPLFHTYEGWRASFMSFLLGIFLFLSGALLAFITYQWMSYIDETVGLIATAMEMITDYGWGPCSMRLFPLLQSISFIGLMLVLITIFVFVITIGEKSVSSILYNHVYITSATMTFHQTIWSWLICWFYLITGYWCVEVGVATGQYVLSFATIWWWFTPNKKKTVQGQFSQMGLKGGGAYVNLEVGGQATSTKASLLQGKDGQTIMVAPIPEKGPDGRNKEIKLGDYTRLVKDGTPGCIVQRALQIAFCYHLGSLAMGAPLVAFTRIPRAIFHTMSTVFLRDNTRKMKHHEIDEDNHRVHGFMHCCSIFASCMDTLFSFWSKDSYMTVILEGKDFTAASEAAQKTLSKETGGGSIVYLHGACAMYELIGVTSITTVCTMVCFWLVTDCIPLGFKHSDPSSDWYIEDPSFMVFIGGVVSVVISYAFMASFNHVADCILFLFAWNRKMHDKEGGRVGPVSKYITSNMEEALGKDAKNQDHMPMHGLEEHHKTLLPFETLDMYQEAFQSSRFSQGPTHPSESPTLKAQAFNAFSSARNALSSRMGGLQRGSY